MMKRFILFTHPTYYPGGGMSDFESDHDTANEAKDAGFAWWSLQRSPYTEAHIFDCETRKIEFTLNGDTGVWQDDGTKIDEVEPPT